MKDLVITSLETITAFGINGEYLFTLDELQNASIAQTEETSDITGKGGRRLSTLKRNKSITVSGTNGMISGGLLEVQTGGTFSNKATKVAWTETITVSSNVAYTEYKAVGTAGSEITEIYVRNSDGTLGTKYVQANAVAAGKFTYADATETVDGESVTRHKLTFNTSELANGTELVVFYQRNITADVLENDNVNFGKKCQLYIDAIGEDKCGNQFRLQFHIPKADFNGEFTFEMGDNQSVHSFEAEALGGACGAGGQVWTFTVFGANTADTPAA